ncbi:MAG: GNAT family N-acetyltransferase [Alphaproteobacteria bacterium]|nr:GNAT family N-acetyltransferase [Alphaproteobacteria bacterium]
MTGKFFIREVDTADSEISETIEKLHRITLREDEVPDLLRGHWWLVYNGVGQAVGYCGLYPSYRYANAGYLIRAGVAAKHRGNGLQKRMIRVREAKARRLGWDWLFSDTCENPASANSLAACGFRMFEPKLPWNSNHKLALYWRKRL